MWGSLEHRVVLERRGGTARAVAVEVGGEVVCDPDQPGPQGTPPRLPLGALEVAIRLQKGLLRQVLGVVVVAHAIVGIAVDVAQVGAVELRELLVEHGLGLGDRPLRLRLGGRSAPEAGGCVSRLGEGPSSWDPFSATHSPYLRVRERPGAHALSGSACLQIRRPGSTCLQIRRPGSACLQIRRPGSACLQIRRPGSACLQIRRPGSACLQIRRPGSACLQVRRPGSACLRVRRPGACVEGLVAGSGPTAEPLPLQADALPDALGRSGPQGVRGVLDRGKAQRGPTADAHRTGTQPAGRGGRPRCRSPRPARRARRFPGRGAPRRGEERRGDRSARGCPRGRSPRSRPARGSRARWRSHPRRCVRGRSGRRRARSRCGPARACGRAPAWPRSRRGGG